MTFLRQSLAATFVLGLAASGLAGCRDDGGGTTGTTSASSGGGSGDGGGSANGTGGSGADSTSTGTGEFVCADLNGPAPVGCEGPEATIQELTSGTIGLDQKVTLSNVVAMSQKFLVSKSKNTGSCLWGVYVSEQVAETGANTGMLILSYGSKATIPEGETEAFCPKLGQEPACDWIPDNVKPGDVLTVVGTNQIFPNPPSCTGDNPPNQVGMRQLSNVCFSQVTGTAAVPTPHVLTPDEITKITSTTDADFHNAWGAVKVRVEDVGVTPDGGEVVGGFGIITLDNGIPVGDKLYYRPYSDNLCHSGPVFSDPTITFNRVDGFHYLNYCSWGLDVNDKCADTDPPSEDCTGNTCPPDMLP